MFLKFLASVIVFFLWSTAGFIVIIGISILFQGGEVGTGITALILGGVPGALGWFVFHKARLSASVCWTVFVVLLLVSFILFSTEERTHFDFAVSLATALLFAVYGFISHKRKRHMPEAGDIGQAAPVVRDTSYLGRITYLASHIANHDVRGQVAHLQRVAKQMIDFREANPAEAHKTTLFAEHYLPKTVELLEKYHLLAETEVKTIAMYETMDRIAGAIPGMRRIYEHNLDGLYTDMVMDVGVDLEVLEQMMGLEGMENTGSL